MYKFEEKLIEGSLPTNSMEVIIGKNLSDSLELEINDELKLSTFERNEADVKVVGIFDLKVASLNKSWIISELNTIKSADYNI